MKDQENFELTDLDSILNEDTEIAGGARYGIVWGYHLKILQQKVNKVVSKGYQPIGGITLTQEIVQGNLKKFYIQPVYKVQ